VASVRDAVGRGDAPAAARDAHTLKGAAANLGAPHLCASAEALEALARAGDLGRASEALQALERAANELEASFAGPAAQPSSV
jgi:two-component system sensor histidine kinase BarA